METSRQVFDPSRMRSKGANGSDSGGDAPLTVTQLGQLIDGVLRTAPPTIRVVGEISGLRDRTHLYFDLKDSQSSVACVMFAGSAKKLRFRPETGLEVVANGKLDFWAKAGKLSFMITSLDPVGEGALELAYRKLVDQLRREGWFDDSRKKPLPSFARRIAVVTSADGAALQDVLDTARRRAPWIEWLVCDVRVQGERAAAQVASAVRMFDERSEELGIDAILVTRGGGSMEDLWAFNEQPVYEAIASATIPVVCAIGHETDTTIAELVSDLRCATPTQATMRLTPDASELTRQIDSLDGSLRGSIRVVHADLRDRLDRAASRRVLRDPGAGIDLARERFDSKRNRVRAALRASLGDLHARLARASQAIERHRPDTRRARLEARLAILERQLLHAGSRVGGIDLRPLESRLRRVAIRAHTDRSRRLESLARQLEAVGPPSVLARGYSMTLTGSRVVRRPEDVSPGQVITTRVMEGEFRSRVESASAAPKLTQRLKRRKRASDNPDQMDLFDKPG